MGRVNAREYRVWDSTEEAALRAGVKKHGLGAWERIRSDSEFTVLAHRTGVQLKDKWRNLVKFRHISADETQSLQPKTSGPWHKKYWAAAAAGKIGLGTTTGVVAAAASIGAGSNGRPKSRKQQQEMETTEEEEEEELEAMMDEPPQRKSARSVKRRNFAELEEPPPEDDDSWEIGDDSDAERTGGVGSANRKRRRPSAVTGGPAEDRRFGIYDQRRYSKQKGELEVSHQADLQHPLHLLSLVAPEAGAGSSAHAAAVATAAGNVDAEQHAAYQQHYNRIQADSGNDQHVTVDDFGGTAEAATVDALRAACRRAHASMPIAAVEFDDPAADEGDGGYVVECPCGIHYDDGNLMIECEHCQAWAHTACLQIQMECDPDNHSYDFMHYICFRCQQLQHIQQQHTPGSMSAQAAAAAAAAAIAAAAAAQLSSSSGARDRLDLEALQPPTSTLAARAAVAAAAASRGSSCDIAAAGQGRSLTPCLPGMQGLLSSGWHSQDALGGFGGLVPDVVHGFTQGYLDHGAPEDLLQPQLQDVQQLGHQLHVSMSLPYDQAMASSRTGTWHPSSSRLGPNQLPTQAASARHVLRGAGFSSGTLAAAEGLASMSHGDNLRLPTGSNEQQAREPHHGSVPDQQQEHSMLTARTTAAVDGDGAVELDQVLQLYLQGSSQAKRGQGTPRASSDGGAARVQSGLNPALQQSKPQNKQQQHGGEWQPEQAIAAALYGRPNGVRPAPTASTAAVPLHAFDTAAATTASVVPVSNGHAVQRTTAKKSPVKTPRSRVVQRKLPPPQPQLLLQHVFAGGRPPQTALPGSRAGLMSHSVPAAAAPQSAATWEQAQPHNSSSGRAGRSSAVLHQALLHHQRELGALLGAIAPPTAAAAASSACLQGVQPQSGVEGGAAGPEQQQLQQPRAATPLWQAGFARGSFTGSQRRRSDAADSVEAHRAAADSPALLVNAPNLDRRDAFGLLGSSLLGSTFSHLYPAMLGIASAGTPPLPSADSRPGTPSAAAAAAAAAVAAMAAGAAAAAARAHSRSPAITPRGLPMSAALPLAGGAVLPGVPASGRQSPALSGYTLSGDNVSRQASAAAAAAAAAVAAAAEAAGQDVRSTFPAVAAAAVAAAAAAAGGGEVMLGGGEGRPSTPFMDVAALFRTGTPDLSTLQQASTALDAALCNQNALSGSSQQQQATSSAFAAVAAAAAASKSTQQVGIKPVTSQLQQQQQQVDEEAADGVDASNLASVANSSSAAWLPAAGKQLPHAEAWPPAAVNNSAAAVNIRPDLAPASAPALDLLAGAVVAVEAAGQGWSPQ